MLAKKQLSRPTWAIEAFSLPPARDVKGRTRWTHRHATWVPHLNRIAFTESRNEFISLLSLEFLLNRNLIRRFKEQPFTLPKEELGFEYTPDFCLEDTEGNLYVIEVKTQRFLTRDIENRLADVRSCLASHGINFRIWTDKTPLVKTLRHNLLCLKKFSLESFRTDERDLLNGQINQIGSVAIGELLKMGVDLGLIYASIYKGSAHSDIQNKFTLDSRISSTNIQPIDRVLLGSCASNDSWWDSLVEVK